MGMFIHLHGSSRFVARRGQPIVILSDNAAQFKLAKSTLERVYGKAISSQPVKYYMGSEQIQWKFITERAPWMGGFYERLVGYVKRALKKSIGRLLLHSVQLCEIEAVVNSRPLTAVSDSPADYEELTPRHFLSFNPRCDPIPAKSTNSLTNTTASDLHLSWKRGKMHLERFWKIWSTDYIAALRERSDYKHRQSKGKFMHPPSVNDVVLTNEEFQPRGKWKMGRVSETYAETDGCVRTVKLQLQDGKSCMRPIKLLYPLELTNDATSTRKEDSKASIEVIEDVDQPCHSTIQEPTEQWKSGFLRTFRPKPVDFPVQLDSDRNSEPSENSHLNSNGRSQRLPRGAKTRANKALNTRTDTSRPGVSRRS